MQRRAHLVVYKFMSPVMHQFTPPTTAYLVQGPRTTDAIGVALRSSYADSGGLPDDMAALLALLYGAGRA